MIYFDIILFRYTLILLLYTMHLHIFIHIYIYIYMEDIFQKFTDEKNKRKNLETAVNCS